jgi:alpha-1,2-mannosyltransferase
MDRSRAARTRLELDTALVWQLAGLGVLAFVIRLVPVLLSGGLHGIIADYDDGVYMGTALAALHGRIVYRDFFMLHPPGIVYVLAPFAALSAIVSDATAMTAARLGFMALGAINTILVGLVARSFSRTAALAAAAFYAAWVLPANVEQTTWLIAPQNTLLLLALLTLSLARGRGEEASPIGWRRAAVAGALIGFAGSIQIWGIVTAGVIFLWLLARTFRQPDGPLRPLVAYSVAGVGTVGLAFLPFFLAAGEKMIRIIIFDQIGRGGRAVSIPDRMRALEGIPKPPVERLHLEILPVVIFVIAAGAIAFVAWRRPGIRLWAALAGAQSGLLLVSPSFFGHYGAWAAPADALCLGAVFAEAVGQSWSTRRSQVFAGMYVAGLAGLLLVTLDPGLVGKRPTSMHVAWQPVTELLANARCPTADAPIVLIETGALRRMLDDGCPVLISPTGVSYDTDRTLRGKERTRPKQVEYQAIMADYYGKSDAAVFMRPPSRNGLSDATWAVIRAHLPVEHKLNKMTVYLPAGS